MSSAGDVDGDGLDDLLIGGYGGTGRAYLVLGNTLGLSPVVSLSQADYSFLGENSFDRAGFSVSGGGDMDGDGLADLLIGAYRNDFAGSDAGKAYLLLSPY